MKKLKDSRVMWFNGLCAAMFALEASLHLFKPITGEQFYPILAGVLAVGNAILRSVTSEPIKKKKAKNEQDSSPNP